MTLSAPADRLHLDRLRSRIADCCGGNRSLPATAAVILETAHKQPDRETILSPEETQLLLNSSRLVKPGQPEHRADARRSRLAAGTLSESVVSQASLVSHALCLIHMGTDHCARSSQSTKLYAPQISWALSHADEIICLALHFADKLGIDTKNHDFTELRMFQEKLHDPHPNGLGHLLSEFAQLLFPRKLKDCGCSK